MKASIASAVLARAGDACECQCGRGFDGSIDGTRTIDHQPGRGRCEDTLEDLWVLRWGCHRAKTDNNPSAAVWLGLFLIHQERHGYDSTKTKKRLEWVLTQAQFGKGAA